MHEGHFYSSDFRLSKKVVNMQQTFALFRQFVANWRLLNQYGRPVNGHVTVCMARRMNLLVSKMASQMIIRPIISAFDDVDVLIFVKCDRTTDEGTYDDAKIFFFRVLMTWHRCIVSNLTSFAICLFAKVQVLTFQIPDAYRKRRIKSISFLFCFVFFLIIYSFLLRNKTVFIFSQFD